VATGTQRDLDGVNLFDPACPVEVVITVEALKEGWDCSFAYVFCSLQKIGSSKDMEQLLGRVLRMPYARRRKSDLLNRAYAHVASAQTMRVANALADKLVAMGFEELEAAQAVFPPPRRCSRAMPPVPPRRWFRRPWSGSCRIQRRYWPR
jgi:type III restriction enzyme